MLKWTDANGQTHLANEQIFSRSQLLEMIRPKGEWIEDYTDEPCHSFLGYHCSVCNTEALDLNDYSFKSNYCPNCGAKMKVGEDNG